MAPHPFTTIDPNIGFCLLYLHLLGLALRIIVRVQITHQIALVVLMVGILLDVDFY